MINWKKNFIVQLSIVAVACLFWFICSRQESSENEYEYTEIYVTQSGKTHFFTEERGGYFITESGDRVRFNGTYKVTFKKRNLLE